jgi:hypothetical protein
VGLWSRVHDFQPEHLLALIRGREVVRATTMRGTLHLLSARDYRRFRATLQPMLTAGMSVVRDRMGGIDVEEVVRVARGLLDERPRDFDELRTLLLAHGFPGDERAMGYAVRMHLPLVQVPSDANWGYDTQSAFALASSWLDTPMHTEAVRESFVERYLAAFGPATPNDAGAWSAMKGLRDVFETLRPKLRVFRDEAGRELFDLPDAPRPPEDVEAPVRFLPEFDNLVLSHDDRSRIVAAAYRPRIVSKNLQVAATFLVDGFVAGTWKVERKRASASMVLTPFLKLTKATIAGLQEEGGRLLGFSDRDVRTHDVRVEKTA